MDVRLVLVLAAALPEVTTLAEHAGRRLDHFLQEQFSGHSRSRLQDWIRRGRVTGGRPGPRKRPYLLRGGEKVSLEPDAPPPLHAFAGGDSARRALP